MFALFGWYVSHYAKNNMPRLIWSFIGLYFIAGSLETDNFFFNPSTYFGLGLLLPHFIFLYEWINEVINTLKLLSRDTYYFFMTVYYKTRNTFYWFVEFYEKIQVFFYDRKNKKAYEKYYKDEEPKQEKTYEYKREGYKKKQESKNEHKQQEDSTKSETKKDYGKYGRFYETDYYVVLGVSRSDDLGIIKKAWRALQKEYHTDLHHNESAEVLKKYTEINQLINNAWDEIKKEKK